MSKDNGKYTNYGKLNLKSYLIGQAMKIFEEEIVSSIKMNNKNGFKLIRNWKPVLDSIGLIDAWHIKMSTQGNSGKIKMISLYLCSLVLNRHIAGNNFRAKYKNNKLSEQKFSPKRSRVNCYQLYDAKPVAKIQKRVRKQTRTSFQKGLQRVSGDLQAITSYYCISHIGRNYNKE